MALLTHQCPVCKCSLEEPLQTNPAKDQVLRCAGCGTHRITGEGIESVLVLRPPQLARVAHGLVQMPTGARVDTEHIEHLAKIELPAPLARIDLLVQHMAQDYEPGHLDGMNPHLWVARLGCVNPDSALWVIQQARALGYLSDERRGGSSLTSSGWQRHGELVKDGAGSRHAFMAMAFGFPEMWSLLRDHLQPAVGQTDFELRALAGAHQTAGSIDNRMRVEIRTARFLICDLTHSNRGAYWEAGFAEGIGRPVFYICRADVLADRTHADHPHFDTAHQLIIPWDQADPGPGMQQLKDAIRATLPAEAKMED